MRDHVEAMACKGEDTCDVHNPAQSLSIPARRANPAVQRQDVHTSDDNAVLWSRCSQQQEKMFQSLLLTPAYEGQVLHLHMSKPIVDLV